jgi:NADH-quinone oxidoreductase subunit L
VAWIDRNIVDGLANGAGKITGTIGQVTRSVQGGKSQLYVTMAFLGLISLLILIILL